MEDLTVLTMSDYQSKIAPNIESLGVVLKTAHEQLAHDLLCVLKKTLRVSEEGYDVQSRKQWRIWWWRTSMKLETDTVSG